MAHRILVVMLMMRVVVALDKTMILLMGQLNVETGSIDAAFRQPFHVKLITVDIQFSKLRLKLVKIDTKVEQRTDEHIAADPGKGI